VAVDTAAGDVDEVLADAVADVVAGGDLLLLLLLLL
jgi:hypothetical protein